VGKRNRYVTAAASAVLAAALAAPPAQAGGRDSGGGPPNDPSGITTVVEGLNGPRQISDKGHGWKVYVAESDSGQISMANLRSGEVTPVVTGLGERQVQGVDVARGQLLVAIGEPPHGAPGTPPPPPAPYGDAVLLGVQKGATPTALHDLAEFERDNNPDGQPQFGENGEPLDVFSNPYFVYAHRDGTALIADAGGNDILRRNSKGELALWRTLPLITDGPCAEIPNNDPAVFGCDPVPTGIAYGNHDDVYVSALGGLVPGAGRVFVYDWARQDPIRMIDGLTGPTGVAVDADGNVYVSEMLENAPTEEPGPDFDPSAVGQIVRIAPDGTRTYAQVTLPAGLLIHKGELYAAAWAVAGELGIPDAGQIVRVDDSAFVAPPA
jgi:DNA-binding beta-propeller fold protein YncE